jgi:excisionase family DNA binding protein
VKGWLLLPSITYTILVIRYDGAELEVALRALDFEKKAFYTPAEIARLFEVHPSTVREWIHSDRLFAYQLSERVTRIPLSSVMHLLGEPPRVIERDLRASEAEAIWRRVSAEHETGGVDR